jgi:hypothetical protein
MADIREGMSADPFYETKSDPNSVLQAAKPPGMTIELDDEGNATANFNEAEADEDSSFYDNLAEKIDPTRLKSIAIDLIEAIETDIEAHERRSEQYRLGLQRTGLGDEGPSAPFAGASKVVHPMLTEAVIDYSARVTNELLPPEGPVKPRLIGKVTQDKTDRADRICAHMNWQLTEQMSSAYSEIEQGFTQQGLAGAFYTKMYVVDGKVDCMVVYEDKVHRPWSDGDFYVQPRITHDMDIDKWTWEENVRSGLWMDEVDIDSTPDQIEETSPQSSNDRIIGKDAPTKNIDDIRRVMECSTRLALKGPDDEVLPYIVTIDYDTQTILAIYRNWDEDDENKCRQDFLVEWPFWPWRGGYPIGLAHMIGTLSGAASGALRALLDAALMANMQTGVKLKGGVTQGGQNIRVNPGSTTEVAGSLAADDIRKTYMPLPFPQPNATLFELLGFLVDSGKSVVRTTFDEFNKVNNETPVGTANMMIEQGLKTFGSVFKRQHSAMKRFLRQLYQLNQKTISDELIMDEFGEPLVYKEDYNGPMCVIPVSDPKIFSDTQRMAQGQLVSGRAQLYASAQINLYKMREAELYLLRAAKVPDPEQFLIDAPQPQQLNAAAENVAASKGLPIAAYPGQDHEAHIAQHAAFIQMPVFGSNPTIALKVLPALIQHVADHMALWYADAMLIATNTMVQETFHDPRITLDALQSIKGMEAPLDRLMADLTPDVMQHAKEELEPAMQVIQQAQQLLQKLQPPQPMDPSIVAQHDVQRQTEKDQADIANDKAELELRGQTEMAKVKQKADETMRKDALAAQEQQTDASQEQQRIDLERAKAGQDSDESSAKHAIAAAGNEVQREATQVAAATQLHTNAADNATALELEARKSETQKEIAADNNDAKVAAAKAKPKPKPPASK